MPPLCKLANAAYNANKPSKLFPGADLHPLNGIPSTAAADVDGRSVQGAGVPTGSTITAGDGDLVPSTGSVGGVVVVEFHAQRPRGESLPAAALVARRCKRAFRMITRRTSPGPPGLA